MYRVNLQTQFVKDISGSLGAKLSNEESAGNDKKHSVNRYEVFVDNFGKRDPPVSWFRIEHTQYSRQPMAWAVAGGSSHSGVPQGDGV